MQTTSHLLMIRPVHFGYNAQTAVNNTFQTREKQGGVQERALREFDTLVVQLRTRGIDVTVIEDSPLPHTPDAIFPNNWISFHDQQTLCLYPMFAPNRRQERKSSV
ncbi:MAG: arginine deiminase-related protein, partial [Chitinophagales bacterium]